MEVREKRRRRVIAEVPEGEGAQVRRQDDRGLTPGGENGERDSLGRLTDSSQITLVYPSREPIAKGNHVPALTAKPPMPEIQLLPPWQDGRTTPETALTGQCRFINSLGYAPAGALSGGSSPGMETDKRKDSCRLKPPHDHSPGVPRGVSCDVAAFASVRIPYDSLPTIRRNPEPARGFPLAVSVLKHLDEQTVACLAAVYRAVRENGLDATSFNDWGVLAAPYLLGQSTMVNALERFRAEGAWGVSPHVIPHHSLHSISGTVSQALKIHGPNLGVGGGPGGAGEALLAAASWIGRRRVPGVWVVLASRDPLAALGAEGQMTAGTTCVALAMALLPARQDAVGLRLRVLPGDDARRSEPPIDLVRMYTALESGRSSRGAGGLVVSAAAPRVELEWGRPGRVFPSAGLLLKAAEAYPAAVGITSGAETER
jgi:hypothetical protein